MAGSVNGRMDRWLAAVGRRIRVRRAARWSTFLLVVWGVGSLTLLGAGRLVPLGWERQAVVVAAGAALVLGAGIGAFLPLPARLVARSADKDLNARDRVATAKELGSRIGSEIESLQVATTGSYIARIRPKDAAPMRIPEGWSRAAVVLGALVALLIGIPNPMDAVGRQRAADAAELEQQADQVRKEAERLKASDLPEEEKALAVEELEDLASRLEDAESLRQGMEEIARSESRLESLVRSDHLAEKTLLANIDRSLQEDPLASGPEGDLAEQLEDLAELLPQLASEERADAAGRLEQMAASLDPSDTELADALREAAEALRKGTDPDALEEAAREVRDAQSRTSAQESLSSARTALQGARAELEEASKSASSSDGEGSEQGEGEGEGEGGDSGEGEGSGEGGASGEGQGSGEVGEGTGTGDGPPGSTGRPGDGAGAGGREGGTGPSGVTSRIYDPILGGEISEELRVEGERGDGPETILGRQEGLTSTGRILIPYSYVYPAWSARAARTVEILPVPASLRSFVRDYFSALEPTGVR